MSEDTRAQTREALIKGAAALRRRAVFSPFLAGERMTAADIMFLFSVDLAGGVAKKLFDLDLLGDMPGAADLIQRSKDRDSVSQVVADREKAMADFQKYVAGNARK